MYYFDAKKEGALYPVGVEKANAKQIIYLHKGTKGNKQKYNFSYTDYETLINSNGIKGRNKQFILKKLEEAYFKDLDTSNMELEDDNFKALYRTVKENEDKKSKYVAHGKIIPLLKPDWFNVVYINGASGAGKSKIAVRMINEYKKSHKKANVYLISKKDSDKMIDQIKGINRIDVESFSEDPIDVSEFESRDVIIFDDFEGYQTNKVLFKQIIGLMNDLMTMGRTKLLQVFIITHLPTFGRDSSLIFQEMTYAIIYPTSCSYHSLKFLLKDKIGLDTQQINVIKSMRSKYVVINKTFPRYVISGDEIELL